MFIMLLNATHVTAYNTGVCHRSNGLKMVRVFFKSRYKDISNFVIARYVLYNFVYDGIGCSVTKN